MHVCVTSQWKHIDLVIIKTFKDKVTLLLPWGDLLVGITQWLHNVEFVKGKFLCV